MRVTDKSKTRVKQLFSLIDSIVFSFIIFLCINGFTRIIRHKSLSALLFLLILISILLLQSVSAYRKRKKEEEEREIREKKDRLLLLSDDTLSSLFSKKHFILIRKADPDRFDVLEAIRRNADAIGIFSSKKQFSDLINTYRPQTDLYDAEDLLRKVYGIGEEKRLRKTILSVLRSNKYLLTGALLLTASFVLKSKIYFRMLSGVCLVLACISGFFGDRARWNKLWIFLDNPVDR